MAVVERTQRDIEDDHADSFQQALPERACGACNLCCKVFTIAEIDKPAGVLCQHVRTGEGCAIHARRPATCHAFFCGWRVDPRLSPEWKPDVAGFAIWIARPYAAMMVTVDPDRPDAWKQEPYHATLRKWGALALREGKRVLVMLNGEATILLPDGEQPLGRLGAGDRIEIFREGANLRARLRHAP